MSENKERITLNFRKNPVISMEEVTAALGKINDKKHGRTVTLHDIIADFVRNHTQRDVKRIQESVMSKMDKVKLKFEREMAKTDKKMSFEDYIAAKLKV